MTDTDEVDEREPGYLMPGEKFRRPPKLLTYNQQCLVAIERSLPEDNVHRTLINHKLKTDPGWKPLTPGPPTHIHAESNFLSVTSRAMPERC